MSSIVEKIGSKARLLAHENSLPADQALELALDELIEAEPALVSQESWLATRASNELFGFGFLQDFLSDDGIEEVWINRPGEIHCARGGRPEKYSVEFTADQLRNVIERMLRSTGRRLDRSSPFVDASLPDGSRLHVVIPDITRQHWSLNIRKFPKRIISLADLVVRGAISENQAHFLSQAVRAGQNILVSGATQSGKTTMLCALLAELPVTERIISVEETFEIRIQGADWVAMQTRQSNLEGVGEVSLRRLVKESLRMRPTRLVVGEVREAESLDLLIALNSGLPGLCTIHSNSAAEAISKLCTLPLLAGQNITSGFVDPTVANCIQLVVHCDLAPSGARSVREISRVEWVSGGVKVSKIEATDALA